MPTIIELQDDVYPFGCKGDVVTLEDAELKELDAELKKRNVRNGYNRINFNVESGSEEATVSEDADVEGEADKPKSSDKKSKK
jgi:hypothetical protein